MFVLPLIIFPLLSVGFGAMIAVLIGKAKEESPKVMVIGGDDSPSVLAGLKKVPRIQIVPLESNWKDEVVNSSSCGRRNPEGFERNLAGEKEQTVLIHDYEGDLKSETAKDKVEKYFNEYRDSIVKDRLAARNLPVSVLKPFEIKPHNVAPPEKSGGALFFGGFIAYIVVFLCLNGGMHPAMDLTAGEKERGTMETILSSPISRSHLVLGKFLLVLTTALTTAALSVIRWHLVRHRQRSAHYSYPGWRAGCYLAHRIWCGAFRFIMAVPLAVLFSSVLITISTSQRATKKHRATSCRSFSSSSFLRSRRCCQEWNSIPSSHSFLSST